MSRPVWSDTQPPARYMAPSRIRTSRGCSRGSSHQNTGNASSVPTVPGALGASPAPNPSARKCAGWLSAKRRLGCTPVLVEVIKAPSHKRNRLARGIDGHHTRAAFHAAHTSKGKPETGSQLDDLCLLGRRRREAQLIVVAAGERTAL